MSAARRCGDIQTMTTAATAIPIPGIDSSNGGGETDHLAAAVLRALGRSFRNQFSLSPSGAFWMALISFGFWPLWKMARQFRDYQTFEKQQFWHLAEWLRVRRSGDETAALHAQIDRLRPGGGFVTTFVWVVCQILVIATIVR